MIGAHFLLDLAGAALVGYGTNVWVGIGVWILMQSIPAVRRS